MQKTILIPTDFTVESLVAVKEAISYNEGNNLNIILLYSCFLTDSISELLFYSPEKIIREQSSKNFHEALSIIQNRFSEQINSISIEVFHGYSARAVEAFIEKNKIDHVYFSKNYSVNEDKNLFDIKPFIKKSKVEFTELINSNENKVFSKNDTLINLFNAFN